MKELSIEEKAKRYDEILARATGAYLPYYTEDIMTKVREFVEYLIPELQESEGEKIRKALIKLVKKAGEGYENVIDGVSIENAISWLEKQGEHANFRNKIQIGDKVTRNRDGMLVNLSQLNRVAKKDENQEYQKPAEWSEEDEEIHRKCICVMRASACGFPEEEDFVEQVDNWLKSLKDRYTWKPSKLPHWKKSTLPNDNTTGFNSDYFCHNGYCINYKELFEKLPKDD